MPSFIETRIAIGRKLKELRISNDMTQNDFAKTMGISRQHLSSIENGSCNWTVDDLIKALIYLKKLSYLDEFFKEQPISPKEQWLIERKRRKRVRTSKNKVVSCE